MFATAEGDGIVGAYACAVEAHHAARGVDSVARGVDALSATYALAGSATDAFICINVNVIE
jgi:hypothetical protein